MAVTSGLLLQKHDNKGYTETMQNPELTPTVITDVNGRITTVHKRAAQQSQKRSAIPPVPPMLTDLVPLKKPAKRAYKPSPAQRSVRRMGFISWHHRIDPKLAETLGLYAPYQGARNVDFSASEVEAYSVFSTVSNANAVVLMENGVRSKEEAYQFLEDHDLMHLADDHSEVMDAALSRKLTFANFALFAGRHYTKEVDFQLFMDAAEANDSVSLRDKPRPVPIPVLVLQGDIALKDIKTMTATKLGSSNCGEATISALIAINKGERDYDAVQLRRALESVKGLLYDEQIIAMLDSVGPNTVSSIRNKKRGYAIHLEMKEKYKRDRFKRMEAMTYSDIMSIYHRDKEDAETVVELWESGVPADVAAKSLNEGMTVPQVIAVHAQNAPSSISTGWL